MRLAFGLADHIKQMAHTWVSNIHLAEGLHRTPKWRSLTSPGLWPADGVQWDFTRVRSSQ